ncbi:hypothetical protein NIES2100_72000 [Calothrix sp. NIES-2100]|uniref:hormogonium polysaccharide secretion pseudopilin HpsB n=1 Tax=Calothrix sp. NIES-2100 TaxID=1954172 RepID=UPI000B5F25C1|nr:hypothetical protein NIES2100_72000 [Calothrix sp. NIES-2100]
MIQRKQPQTTPLSDDSGFTIVESLMAIVVVSILLAAIAPVLIMSTSTRVQARRVELATRVAKTFIDGVKTGSITAPTKTITLEAPTTAKPRTLADNLVDTTKMPVPTKDDTDLYCFKNNTISVTSTTNCQENNFDQFYIQAAQIKVKDSSSDDGYRLAIRVYRSDIDFSKSLLASTSTSTKQKTFTGGLGSKQAPLVEMTTDINNVSTTFQALCQRFGPASGKTCQ